LTAHDEQVTIGELAELVRSKNAGPFWLTLDVFFDNDAHYNAVANSAELSEARIAQEYGVDADHVAIYRMPTIRAIKISFPRRTPQGSFHDRDMHSGQQHIRLAGITVDVVIQSF
jgi:hypothetical protein